MAVNINAIATVILMGVSGFAGYKVGAFEFTDLYEDKIQDIREKAERAIQAAQKEHENRLNEVEQEYEEAVDSANKVHKKEVESLEAVIADKEEEVGHLQGVIDDNSLKLAEAKERMEKLVSERERLEKGGAQETTITDEELMEIRKVKKEIEQTDIEIDEMADIVTAAIDRKEGLECLDKYVPINLEEME